MYRLLGFGVLLLAAFVMLTSCGPGDEELATLTNDSARATLAALPTATAHPTYTPLQPPPTFTPMPTLTQLPPLPTLTTVPSPTPLPTRNLSDLFCGYGFCVAHPAEVYLVDYPAPDTYASYDEGYVVGFHSGLGMYVEWEKGPASIWDDTEVINGFLIDFMIENETPVGDFSQETIGGNSFTFQEFFLEDPEARRPYSTAAATYCGDRGFLLSISADKEGQSTGQLKKMLEQFRCE